MFLLRLLFFFLICFCQWIFLLKLLGNGKLIVPCDLVFPYAMLLGYFAFIFSNAHARTHKEESLDLFTVIVS